MSTNIVELRLQYFAIKHLRDAETSKFFEAACGFRLVQSLVFSKIIFGVYSWKNAGFLLCQAQFFFFIYISKLYPQLVWISGVLH